ncbi:hypothetical protein AXF42_Ash004003 [Apostasia shenzhenica]|uniref:Uncharacterized protein n=1 Tax=Apostasia shenzhenica TaxID=1088818 RepID=A0A2I0AIH3_9ASPA|nr:hypothetical protein AXF42_Ash004003 [Apostasia shenzhenica]
MPGLRDMWSQECSKLRERVQEADIFPLGLFVQKTAVEKKRDAHSVASLGLEVKNRLLLPPPPPPPPPFSEAAVSMLVDCFSP